jgi:hypothetical protein
LASGLEVMEHAIEHLTKETDRDTRFAVLHADNAVELVLKEVVRFKRIRLIDKKGQSISYYDCIDKLLTKRVSIPELPDIDLLHTERNSIYHLGSQPDQRKAEWLVYDVALNFIRRICKDELGYDIARFSDAFKLSPEVKQEIEFTRSEIVNMYLGDSISALNSNMYNATVILAYSGIEALFRKSVSREIRSHYDMLKTMREERIVSESIFRDLEVLRQIRNQAVHGVSKCTVEEAKFALKVFEKVIGEIGLPEKRSTLSAKYASVKGEFDLPRFQTNLRALDEVGDSEIRSSLIGRIRDQITDLPYDGMPHDMRKAIIQLLLILKKEAENEKMRRLCLDILHIITGRRDNEVNTRIKALFLSWIEENYQDFTLEEKQYSIDIRQMLYKHYPKFIKELMLDSLNKWSEEEFDALYKEIEFDRLNQEYIQEFKILLWKLANEAKKKQLEEKMKRIEKLLSLSYFR